MLSDFAFATDKWYWQTLVYILSIILTFVDFIFFMATSNIIYDGRHDEFDSNKPRLIFCLTLILANVAFGVYASYFDIRYIIEF